MVMALIEVKFKGGAGPSTTPSQVQNWFLGIDRVFMLRLG
jgi:hypothetical protein